VIGSLVDGLYVEESGPLDAPLVALVHGSMDRSVGMAKLVRRLEPTHRVLRYDRRGYSRSRAVPGPYTVDANVDDLLRLLADRPAIVFGHSFGGDVALAAAHRPSSSIAAVLAYEPPLSWLDWWPISSAGSVALAAGADGGASSEDAGERFMRRLIGDRVWERLPERTRAERRADGAALVGELSDLRRAAPWPEGAVAVDTIVACGEHALAHHARANRWFAEHVPGAECVVLAGAHHGAHGSHPDDIAALIERLEARSSGRSAF
jgi:pimeloyl-ACP methyl ester carboxylesterase